VYFSVKFQNIFYLQTNIAGKSQQKVYKHVLVYCRQSFPRVLRVKMEEINSNGKR